MLLIFCNMMELLRMRESLIVSLSETRILEGYYTA